MRLCLLCEWFCVDSHLGTFHFGSTSSLMVALVKGHFLYLQMFPNFCVQIYSFGLGLGVRLRV